jgi:hypothetical protein
MEGVQCSLQKLHIIGGGCMSSVSGSEPKLVYASKCFEGILIC